jgi:hypothetical protein
MDDVEIFFCQFPNPWALGVSGKGCDTSKCEKSQNHYTLLYASCQDVVSDAGGAGRTSLIERLPFTCIQRTWIKFNNGHIKFVRNKKMFNKELKDHFVSQLNILSPVTDFYACSAILLTDYNLYYLIPYRILINTYSILSSLNYSCFPFVRSAVVCGPPPPSCSPPPLHPSGPYSILMHHVPCCTASCPVQSPPCRVVPCPCLPLSHRPPTENNLWLCGRPAGHQHCTVQSYCYHYYIKFSPIIYVAF